MFPYSTMALDVMRIAEELNGFPVRLAEELAGYVKIAVATMSASTRGFGTLFTFNFLDGHMYEGRQNMMVRMMVRRRSVQIIKLEADVVIYNMIVQIEQDEYEQIIEFIDPTPDTKPARAIAQE